MYTVRDYAEAGCFAALHESCVGRFCCKSLFALAIKISFRCTRDFRVKMWGTSSPEDKLAGDLGNVIETTSTGGRRSDFFYSGKISTGQFGTFTTISANNRHVVHLGAEGYPMSP
jgi:hypothetical protein